MISNFIDLQYTWDSHGNGLVPPRNLASSNYTVNPNSLPYAQNAFLTLNPNGEPPSVGSSNIASMGSVPDSLGGAVDNLTTWNTCQTMGVNTDDWSYDFSSLASLSWNFHTGGTDTSLDANTTAAVTFVFDSGNSGNAALPTYVNNDCVTPQGQSSACPNIPTAQQPSASNPYPGPSWPVYSVVDTCDIKPDATFVVGFFVCRKLIIEARSAPLQIIGTFAVRDMTIDPSALAAGIKWSSMFHPDALYQLRAAGILLPHGNITLNSQTPPPSPLLPADCNSIFSPTSGGSAYASLLANPVWHPNLALYDTANMYGCSVGALRGTYPTPFTWTTFKPVCGPLNGQTQCSYRDERFTTAVIGTQTNL